MARVAKKLQTYKVEAVGAAKDLLKDYQDFIFTDYRGLTVAQISGLRKQLRAKNCKLKVVKNNYTQLAFEELKVESAADFLKGPTAVALAKEDTNEVAKILFTFAKEVPALQIKGGILANERYDGVKLEAFSKLPGKKQLIAMLMSAINGPVQKIAATLQAYVDKRTAEAGAVGAA
jgi:large subunit ribosomal protein L10